MFLYIINLSNEETTMPLHQLILIAQRNDQPALWDAIDRMESEDIRQLVERTSEAPAGSDGWKVRMVARNIGIERGVCQ